MTIYCAMLLPLRHWLALAREPSVETPLKPLWHGTASLKLFRFVAAELEAGN